MGYINWSKMTDDEIVSELGKRCKKIRLEKNLTQTQMADLSGIDRVTISKIENGRPAGISSWIQILRVLGKLDIWSFLDAETAIASMGIQNNAESRLRASSSKKNKKVSVKSSISFDID